jgi:uncharacterized protein YjiS (DUF1127 family)
LIKELAMDTTWNRPVAVSRGAGSRLADAAAGATSWLWTAVRGLWQRWRAARLRAAEWRALRELSPSVLRDIGAAPESIYEAQRRGEQRFDARAAALRLM